MWKLKYAESAFELLYWTKQPAKRFLSDRYVSTVLERIFYENCNYINWKDAGIRD
jgi:hypothetical protein